MKRFFLGSLAAAAVVAAPAIAAAEGFVLGVDAGASIFVDAKTGFGIEFYPGYEIIDNLDLELELGFQRMAEGPATIAVIPIQPGARYTFDLGGVIAPFAHAHLGPAIVQSKVELSDAGFFEGGTVRSSATRFGINFGGGAHYLITETMGVGLGLTYHHLFADHGGLDIIDIGADFRIRF